jgi:hypothetical protein
VLALAIVGTTVASAAAALPQLEYTLPEAVVVSGGQMVIETPSESVHSPVTCTSTSGTGEMTGGQKEFAALTLRLKGCLITKLSGIPVKISCTSAGAAEGEIVTKSLGVRVEYISKASHEVGLIFGYGKKAATVASFSCAGYAASVSGEFMAKMTPVGVLATKFPLALKGAKGAPEYTQFENESGAKVALSPFEFAFNASVEKANLNATGLTLEFSNAARLQA